MQIRANSVVLLEYTLTDEDANVLDSSQGREPLAYLHGGGNIIPGLERALEGRAAGDAFSVTVVATEAYGERDDSLVMRVPKERFEDAGQVEIGSRYHASGDDGEMRVVTVVGVDDESVTIDANHPLAGMSLTFAIEVVEVREATTEELSHGHVHGPGGHHH